MNDNIEMAMQNEVQNGAVMQKCVDIVFCLDMTMDTYRWDNLMRLMHEGKESFYKRLTREGQSTPDALRVRFVLFRDYKWNDAPMVESRFFDMSTEYEDAVAFLEAQPDPCGGGDAAENSLEALVFAMKSDWVKTDSFKRHIVVLFTDEDAKPLGECKDCPDYPANMPTSLDELVALWGEMDVRAGNLIMLAPPTQTYLDLCNKMWDLGYYVFSCDFEGCSSDNVGFEEAMSLISITII